MTCLAVVSGGSIQKAGKLIYARFIGVFMSACRIP
jgi:hypothetical protein